MPGEINKGKNYLAYQPIHDAHKQIRWKGKQEKYTKAHRAEVAELLNIRRYVDIVQRAGQPGQMQAKKYEQE